MNTDQSNHLDMYRAVHKHCTLIQANTNNQAITNTVPAFAQGIIVLSAKIGFIETTSAQQEQAITGVTLNKEALRLILIDVTLSVISPVRAYAVSISDNDLEEQMNFSRSDLAALSVAKISQTAENLLSIINPLLPNLAPFGIAQANLNAWQTAITNYKNKMEDPRIAIVHRKTLTSELEKLFTDTNTLCNKTLDPLAINFKTTQPHFYEDYINSREIIDLGTRHAKIIGKVKSASGNPIYQAEVKVNEQALTARTDTAGDYLHEPVSAPTVVTLTATAPLFKSKTTPPIDLSSGQTLTQDFDLDPV